MAGALLALLVCCLAFLGGVVSQQNSTSCPLIFDNGNLQDAMLRCGLLYREELCCVSVGLAVREARVKYAQATGKLFLDGGAAADCISQLQNNLAALNVTYGANATLRTCRISADNFTASSAACSAATSASNANTEVASVSSRPDGSRSSCATVPYGYSAQGCKVPCIASADAYASFFSTGSPTINPSSCSELVKLSLATLAVNPTQQDYMSHCFWDPYFTTPCTSMNFSIIDFGPIYNACVLNQDDITCQTTLTFHASYAFKQYELDSGHMKIPWEQREACFNEYRYQLELNGINQTRQDKVWGLPFGPLPKFNFEIAYGVLNCGPYENISAIAAATGNFSGMWDVCLPGRCDYQTCPNATFATAAPLANTLPNKSSLQLLMCETIIAQLWQSQFAKNLTEVADLVNCYSNLPDPFKVRVKAITPELLTEDGGDNRVALIVGVVAAGCIALIVPLLAYLAYKRAQSKGWGFTSSGRLFSGDGKLRLSSQGGSNSSIDRKSNRSVSVAVHGASFFSLKVLTQATAKFSDSCLLGKGGYGRVYKAKLPDVGLVAIKRGQKSSSSQGDREFIAEVETLSNLNHTNLVKLVGYCDEKGERVLIYEFLSGGGLDKYLYGSKKGSLTLGRRIHIALAAARGLEYLHVHADPPVIHRDVKATNILLDDQLRAKVADFGLSRVLPNVDETHLSTDIMGTPGYLDPEYCSSLQLTTASDVYGFGVILLEVVSSRPAVDRSKKGDETSLVNWARDSVESGLSIADPRVDTPALQPVLAQVTALALRCTDRERRKRPTMTEVVRELEQIVATSASDLTEEQVVLDLEARNASSASTFDTTGVSLTSSSGEADSSMVRFMRIIDKKGVEK